MGAQLRPLFLYWSISAKRTKNHSALDFGAGQGAAHRASQCASLGFACCGQVKAAQCVFGEVFWCWTRRGSSSKPMCLPGVCLLRTGQGAEFRGTAAYTVTNNDLWGSKSAARSSHVMCNAYSVKYFGAGLGAAHRASAAYVRLYVSIGRWDATPSSAKRQAVSGDRRWSIRRRRKAPLRSPPGSNPTPGTMHCPLRHPHSRSGAAGQSWEWC